MELQLMELRKQAGYKNRDDFAELLGVNRHTYRSWENGAAMMSLEQAYNVSRVLGCTLDELAGRTPPPTNPQQSASESELLQHFSQCNNKRREAVLTVLADCALASMMDTCKAVG